MAMRTACSCPALIIIIFIVPGTGLQLLPAPTTPSTSSSRTPCSQLQSTIKELGRRLLSDDDSGDLGAARWLDETADNSTSPDYSQGNSTSPDSDPYGGNTKSSPVWDKGVPAIANNSSGVHVVPIVVAIVVASALVVALLVFWWLRRRRRWTRLDWPAVNNKDEEMPPPPPPPKPYNNLFAEDGRPKRLTLASIKRVTNNFQQLLGQGAFGQVYLGNLQGINTAVKQLTRKELINVTAEQFESEMGILMKVKHKNLVKLLAYCSKGVDKFLCFEYLSGGSLDKLLYEGALDWERRYHIITEVCNGLHYLHAESDSEEKILHMDLKASNILLDQGGKVVKIADFGISRLVDTEKPHEYVISAPIGTRAYLPPECLTDKPKVSEKLDIYSYGMLLLEMITGWRATDEDFPGVPTFVEKASHALASRDVQNLLDVTLRVENCSDSVRVQVLTCISIAVDCLDSDPNKRPDTKQIAQKLDS